MDGKTELICCSIDGEVRGYLPPSVAGGYGGGSTTEECSALEEMYKKKRVSVCEGGK